MNMKALVAALMMAAGAASAAPLVGVANNPANTKHIVTYSDTPTGTNFVDQFTFVVPNALDKITAKVTSQMNVTSAGMSDLDFSTIVISGNDKNYKFTHTGFDAPNKTEVWELLSSHTLSQGVYTMTLTGTTTNNAKYSGSLTLTSVTPVPEPETYSMILLGLGLVGFSAARRKSEKFS